MPEARWSWGSHWAATWAWPSPGGTPTRRRAWSPSAGTAKPGGPFAAIYGLAAGLAGRHPEKANRLSAWGFRRALPAAVAEAVVAGGLACEIAPQVVDAVTAMNPPTPLLDYPGPVWLVNAARDHFRRDERDFLRACRDGRLSVCPGRNHITLLADTAILARIVLDAVVVAEAATPLARRTTTSRSCAPGPLAAPRREAATVPGVGGVGSPGGGDGPFEDVGLEDGGHAQRCVAARESRQLPLRATMGL